MEASCRLENKLHRAGFFPIAGADEAGRGACAGPLVAAAAIVTTKSRTLISGLRDSKLLRPHAREVMAEEIKGKALAWSIVEISPEECDQLGMQEANLQALRRALLKLSPHPAFALTDGFAVPGLGFRSLGVWKGDQISASIAAASVLAKVSRDQIMQRYAKIYPAYDFSRHKGYCTAVHQQLLEEHGPCAIHRMRYDNVAKAARLSLP